MGGEKKLAEKTLIPWAEKKKTFGENVNPVGGEKKLVEKMLIRWYREKNFLRKR